MTLNPLALFGIALIPLLAVAQPAIDAAYLRNKAISEGSVELKVITRPVADAALTPSSLTEGERIAIQRAQHKILTQLISRGLVVGNEINVATDGSFTMRVLPDGVDLLAASTDVAALDSPTAAQGARP